MVTQKHALASGLPPMARSYVAIVLALVMVVTAPNATHGACGVQVSGERICGATFVRASYVSNSVRHYLAINMCPIYMHRLLQRYLMVLHVMQQQC